jgi:DHA1 family inner membrane transport protein
MVPIAGLFAATVAVVTASHIVAGLLPRLAAEFDVDISTAGLLITGYALGLAIISPIVALLTGGLPRKRLLLAAITVFVLGNLLCAVSTGYWMLLGARLLVACCHGLIFGLATVLATRLAPEGRRTSAVSLVVAGSTVASIVGLPLGTAIGNAYGWRTSFWLLAAVGIVAAIVLALLIPAAGSQPQKKTSAAAEFRLATRPVVLLWYAVFACYMLSGIVIFAYIVPLLTEVSGVPVDMVPWVLFGVGVTGFFGNLIGGRLADRHPMPVMAGILAALVLVNLVMAQVMIIAWAMVAAIWIRWLIGFGFPAPLRAQILKEAREAPTLASMLSTTASNFGAAAAAALGGAALAAGWGYASLPLIGATAAGIGLLGTLALWGYQRRRVSPA